MEALSCVMRRAVDRGIYRGLRCGRAGPVVSHFIYADDVVFLGEWDSENVINLKRILRCFYLVSGLKVNLAKCRVYGVVLEKLERIRRVFFWGGTEDKDKISWVAWNKVITPQKYGGVGLELLKDSNLAMLAKW
ncbi:uncharacterized protein LOC143585294 [Bidens hawaiensis]|uniref:uncharacterized protein LOC143585294 n=1 Tax=Bidens hawaiensis TaxID=980011 RepID=UPI00404A8211